MIEKTLLAQKLGTSEATIEMLVKMDLLIGPRDHVTPESLERLAFTLSEVAMEHRAERMPTPKLKVDGYVYFAWSESESLVKIGWSGNPEVRLRDFKTATAGSVRLVYQTKAVRMDERRIHTALKRDRTSGEWFRPSTSLTALIRALEGGASIKGACDAAEEARLRGDISAISHKTPHKSKPRETKSLKV